MEYQEYLQRTEQASRLAGAGKYNEAVDVLYKLVLSDISDIDKAVLCVSLAMACDRMGKSDEALSWYDKGVGYEQAYCRYEVTEKKVQYLAQIGRSRDAIPLFESLLKEPYLSESEKIRIRKALQALLGKSTAEWK
jgi:tetratricopeptide (TPR) repeat protein